MDAPEDDASEARENTNEGYTARDAGRRAGHAYFQAASLGVLACQWAASLSVSTVSRTIHGRDHSWFLQSMGMDRSSIGLTAFLCFICVLDVLERRFEVEQIPEGNLVL